MPIGEIIAGIVQNSAWDGVKAIYKGSDSPFRALEKAAFRAREDFFEKYGEEFGSRQDCFLARRDNWDKILRSLFLTSERLSAESLDPTGFWTKAASEESVAFFLDQLQARISEDFTLDAHFTQKNHIVEQTEVARETKENTQLLLEIREDGRQTREMLVRQEIREACRVPYDLERQKDAVADIIEEQIDACRDLIQQQPSVAIKMLVALNAKKGLSDRLRFRIITNIAAARLRIGNDQVTAAKEMLQAERLAPDDKKAFFNSSLAHWILKNPQAAKDKANEAIRLFPRDPEPYQALLISLEEDDSCRDPLPLIPAEVLSYPEVCLQIGSFFHRRGDPAKSRKWVTRAYQLNRKDPDVSEAYATALLEELIEQPAVAVGRQLTEIQRAQLVEASEIFFELWENGKETEVSRRYNACVFNLSNIYRLLGDEAGALLLIDEALRKHPDDPDLQKQRCFCLLSQERFPEACAALATIPDDAFNGKLLIEAETLAAMERFDEALTKVEKFIANLSGADPVSAVANVVRVQLVGQVAGTEDALGAANHLADLEPTNVMYLLLVSEQLSAKGQRDEAVEWAHKAMAIASEKGCYIEVSSVADAYYDLGLHREAAAAYERLITSYEDSRNLRRLFSSYLSADQRAEALKLLGLLPAHVKGLPFYTRSGANLLYRLGDLNNAREFFERCAKQAPEDLELALNHILLVEKMGEPDLAGHLLNQVPQPGKGSPRTLVRLSHMFARYQMRERALTTAYHALRNFGSVPEVHLGYCGLLLNVLKDVAVIDQVRDSQRVAVDTAFTCLTESGKSRTFLVESELPRMAEEEISPDHLIARRAIGLRTGDSVAISDSPVGQEMAEITEVKHKYLHALHLSMENFQYKFPDAPGMWALALRPTEAGGLDFQPVLDLISQRKEAILDTEQIYQSHPVPLALVAHRLGEHPIDCLLGISRRVRIRCCHGASDEREAAFRAVAVGGGFVVDPFSLYTFHRLRLLDFLVAIAQGKLGIVQSTLDLFSELIETRRAMGPCLFVAKEQHQFVKEEVSKESIDASLVIFEELVAWCRQHCEIVPALGKGGIAEEGRGLFEGLHPAFLDTLLAASSADMVLVSEDLHYREIALACFEVKGAWAQALLQAGRDRRLLTGPQYHEAILQLSYMNYGFISLSADNLMFHLAKGEFRVGEDFRRLLKWLSEDCTSLATAINVASIFLNLLFEKMGPGMAMERVTYEVLTQLTRHPGATQTAIYRALRIKMTRAIVLAKDLRIDDVIYFYAIFLRWGFGNFIRE